MRTDRELAEEEEDKSQTLRTRNWFPTFRIGLVRTDRELAKEEADRR